MSVLCRILLCGLAALTIPAAVSADEQSDAAPFRIERPFLWSIRSPDAAAATSWLFGTIHVPDEEFTTLHPAARRAFDAAGIACFEVDFMANMADQMNAITLPDDQSLSDLLPPKLLNRLDARLKSISPLMTRDALPEAHVVVWPLLLANLEAQVRELGSPPLDLKLYLEARSAGKAVGGLEDGARQLQPLIDLPLDDQIAFLRATLDGMDEDDENNINRLELTMRKYASGDAEEFAAFMQAEMDRLELRDELTQRIHKALLTDRNRTMADSIHGRVSAAPSVPHFFAVGLGHLTGDQTVQDALRERGYRVKREEPEATAVDPTRDEETPETPRP